MGVLVNRIQVFKGKSKSFSTIPHARSVVTRSQAAEGRLS